MKKMKTCPFCGSKPVIHEGAISVLKGVLAKVRPDLTEVPPFMVPYTCPEAECVMSQTIVTEEQWNKRAKRKSWTDHVLLQYFIAFVFLWFFPRDLEAGRYFGALADVVIFYWCAYDIARMSAAKGVKP